MIPDIGKQLLENSIHDANQNEKKRWQRERLLAYNYYKGRTNDYTAKFFSDELIKKIPIANVNLTKRIIDRVSMVYMKPPKRTYSNENFMEMIHYGKDEKLQKAERLTNLLELILIKPCWRNGQVEYDLIRDFEPHFFNGDNLHPDAFTYPIAIRSEVLSTEPEKFVYWDEENTFTYDKNGKIYTTDDNPDMINPYGMLPFVECFKDGRPDWAYLDTDASVDLVATNKAVNIAETNKNANIMFQSFGYMYINGSSVDYDKLEVGQDKISQLGVDGTLNIVSPPNSVPALTESIKESYKMLAQNYHLSVNFVEGTTAESGVALKLRNQELSDARISDVVRWKVIEQKLFEIEERIVTVETGMANTGTLDDIDFDESTEVLNPQEQIERWNWELEKGMIDVADILMQKNPDLTREEALEFLEERNQVSPEAPQNTLLEALATPTT